MLARLGTKDGRAWFVLRCSSGGFDFSLEPSAFFSSSDETQSFSLFSLRLFSFISRQTLCSAFVFSLLSATKYSSSPSIAFFRPSSSASIVERTRRLLLLPFENHWAIRNCVYRNCLSQTQTTTSRIKEYESQLGSHPIASDSIVSRLSDV